MNDNDVTAAAVRWCIGTTAERETTVEREATATDTLASLLDAASIAGGDVRVERARCWGEPARRATGDGWLVVEGGERPSGLCVGVVGTRRIPASEVARVDRHVRAVLIDPRVTLVSGGALGADAIAHDVAADLGRPAVIVLAGGLAHAGPRRHRDVWRALVASGGALVTARPPNEPPVRGAWLRRNELIAALCDVLCLVAAPERSGALSTVRHALDLGRPVCVMPWAVEIPWAQGSNRLLGDHRVRPWLRPDDVFDAAGLSATASTTHVAVDMGLSPDARALRDALAAAPLLGMDGAADRLGWDAPRLQAARLDLMLAGWDVRA